MRFTPSEVADFVEQAGHIARVVEILEEEGVEKAEVFAGFFDDMPDACAEDNGMVYFLRELPDLSHITDEGVCRCTVTPSTSGMELLELLR